MFNCQFVRISSRQILFIWFTPPLYVSKIFVIDLNCLWYPESRGNIISYNNINSGEIPSDYYILLGATTWVFDKVERRQQIFTNYPLDGKLFIMNSINTNGYIISFANKSNIIYIYDLWRYDRRIYIYSKFQRTFYWLNIFMQILIQY